MKPNKGRSFRSNWIEYWEASSKSVPEFCRRFSRARTAAPSGRGRPGPCSHSSWQLGSGPFAGGVNRRLERSGETRPLRSPGTSKPGRKTPMLKKNDNGNGDGSGVRCDDGSEDWENVLSNVEQIYVNPLEVKLRNSRVLKNNQ